ncbi:MAG: hypothetical protein WC725_05125 [Patescibacteria group bacterium]|jgi:hypothetical protein
MTIFKGQKVVRKSTAAKVLQECNTLSLFDTTSKYAVANRQILNSLPTSIPTLFTVVTEENGNKAIQEYFVTN